MGKLLCPTDPSPFCSNSYCLFERYIGQCLELSFVRGAPGLSFTQRYCSVSHTLVLLQISKVPFQHWNELSLVCSRSCRGFGGGAPWNSLFLSDYFYKGPSCSCNIFPLFYGKEAILLCSESGVLPEIPCGLGPGFFQVCGLIVQICSWHSGVKLHKISLQCGIWWQDICLLFKIGIGISTTCSECICFGVTDCVVCL